MDELQICAVHDGCLYLWPDRKQSVLHPKGGSRKNFRIKYMCNASHSLRNP